eukprot:CAMPEP_0201163360 /NCGR_PEP_ID=MMETSP0851-20130426/55709_1 /ASSEMBLY_ACC=CAM_ASM_000631 /TAXON_ID=183588 /ORGANISM="Pseudo-nitzschia fraudulenta, Strain WWA7" /LENGTH=68 /DNA_ID=CAMNT_0047443461 /DNA_START=274 /DNA_END=480 /DNA_ORIENTATION=-
MDSFLEDTAKFFERIIVLAVSAGLIRLPARSKEGDAGPNTKPASRDAFPASAGGPGAASGIHSGSSSI